MAAQRQQQQNGRRQPPKADWTIMVYIAADDVLANFAIESLKQLKVAAGRSVVVAAQLDVDGPFSRQRIRRYIFDNHADVETTIDKYIVKTLDAGTNMVDPRTLTAFIDDIYNDPRCDASRHALVLWGHGPELLTESVPMNGQAIKIPLNGSTKLFLTPSELAHALNDAHLNKTRKLDIIALDTCSSSLAEIAAELPSYADFLVASQEDVPDMSFPYDRLLQLFRQDNTKVEEICKTTVKAYLKNYQDYIFGANTGTSKVSLSTVALARFGTIRDPIKSLAAALLSATSDETMSSLILEARKASHGFVAGLFVDLVDFCENMLNQFTLNSIKNGKLQTACRAVINSFRANGKSTCVIANAALEPTQCHGLSIYFPFLNEEDAQQMGIPLDEGADPLVKGGDIATKGGNIPTKGGDIATKMRRQRIAELEADYADSELFKQTNWYGFIRDGWSRLLARRLPPEELDLRYSAQQCAVNLLNSAPNKR